jgi:hypothetical protein
MTRYRIDLSGLKVNTQVYTENISIMGDATTTALILLNFIINNLFFDKIAIVTLQDY